MANFQSEFRPPDIFNIQKAPNNQHPERGLKSAANFPLYEIPFRFPLWGAAFRRTQHLEAKIPRFEAIPGRRPERRPNLALPKRRGNNLDDKVFPHLPFKFFDFLREAQICDS